MLSSVPSKRGFGITLYGDHEDLRSLHQTVHRICGGSFGDLDVQNESALSIAYELRKAYEGKRETIIANGSKNRYFATNIDWPAILFYTSYLRHRAGFCPTNIEDQSNPYLVEFCVANAIVEYDHRIGNKFWNRYGTIGCVCKDLTISYVSEISYDYLYGGGSEK